jgi:hypothetical protein
MGEHSTDDLVHALRERGARYIVDTQGQAFAVLLSLEEYEHYLDLLDDEADSQDTVDGHISCLKVHSGV